MRFFLLQFFFSFALILVIACLKRPVFTWKITRTYAYPSGSKSQITAHFRPADVFFSHTHTNTQQYKIYILFYEQSSSSAASTHRYVSVYLSMVLENLCLLNIVHTKFSNADIICIDLSPFLFLLIFHFLCLIFSGFHFHHHAHCSISSECWWISNAFQVWYWIRMATVKWFKIA